MRKGVVTVHKQKLISQYMLDYEYGLSYYVTEAETVNKYPIPAKSLHTQPKEYHFSVYIHYENIFDFVYKKTTGLQYSQ